ncbi:ABC transporter permease [Flagellimonas sp.]|uniref:ABC transporter permease n=1 Tax=Flagellimonas sp. TaxID=2058762 RepID=UPI003B520ADD
MINIVGLSIGLSASFVIGILIYYDFTFDKFHKDASQIYRVTTDWFTPEGELYNRGVAVPLAQTLKSDVPGIESVGTFFNTNISKVEDPRSEKAFKEIRDVIYTDASYFEMFSYEWLSGSPKEVLSNPMEVVLTKSRAAKYFPLETAQQILGHTLIYNDSITVKVAGVVEDFKERSDLNFNEFLSLKTAIYSPQKTSIFTDSWINTNSATQVFVKLGNQSSIGNIRTQLDKIAEDNADESLTALGMTRAFKLQPLSDIHFNGAYGKFDNNSGVANKEVLMGLAMLALFLLLLGCANFINLNTAQVTKRAKEVGIRKTLGSSRKQLVSQFLGETFILILSATVLSLLVSFYLFRAFSDFIPFDIGLHLYWNPFVVITIVILLLVVTLLSGFYPAMVLSRFRPVKALKSKNLKVGKSGSLRRYLTVFQFTIAQVLIVATLFVGKQLNFLMSKDMGFKTEANAYVRAWHGDLGKRINFVQALESIPEVSAISLAKDPPASSNTNSTMATFFKEGQEINTELQQLFGDLNYLKLYDIQLLAGRDRLNDTIKELVINETYSRNLGFDNPQDALDQQIALWENETGTIVGVMEDFYHRSLHFGIRPMALMGDTNRESYTQFNTIHFSLESTGMANLDNSIAKVQQVWESIYPEEEFEVNFVDDAIRQFYEQERKTANLLKWATALAILISCLGLLGLVIHSTERRTKELGIRKVLGASILQLNLLLCKEFLALVVIAFVIGAPIAWYSLNNWLEGFAYKTTLSWGTFAFGGLTTLIIALLVMSFRTTVAANTNPVKSLHTE